MRYGDAPAASLDMLSKPACTNIDGSRQAVL